MRRRLASFAIVLGLGASLPLAGAALGGAAPACAASDQRAALVVDTGAGATSYCVDLGAASVTGLDVIRLAHAQYGLDYRLGFGGRAVCRLAGVGVEGDDCFGAFPDYWGYWRGDGNGGWIWSGTGAADTAVVPGDVEGWSWGAGQDGSTHPAPPQTREEDVCPPASPSPSPSPSDGGGGGGGQGAGGGHDAGSGSGGAGPAATTAPVSTPTPTARPSRGPGGRPDRTPVPTASIPASAAAAVRAAGPGDADAAGGGMGGPLLALAVIVVLGGAGSWMLRRRRAGP